MKRDVSISSCFNAIMILLVVVFLIVRNKVMKAMRKVLRQVISFCLDVLRTLLVVIVLVLFLRKPDNVAHDRLLLPCV